MERMDSIKDIDAVIRLWEGDLARAVAAGDATTAEEVEDNLVALRRYRIQYIQRTPGWSQQAHPAEGS